MTKPETTSPQADSAAHLKALIQDLHQGLDPETAKARFDRLVGSVSPGQLGAMEETLIREGTPVREIQRLCDLHVAVVRGGLDNQPPISAPPGHPVHTYLAENEVIAGLADRLGEIASGSVVGGVASAPGLTGLLEEISGVHNHYLRKENQLFPFLERHGITGPPKVMWGVHDEVRRQVKEARGALAVAIRAGGTTESESAAAGEELQGRLATEEAFGETAGELRSRLAALARSVAEMVFKENRILLPMALQRLTPSEWVEVRRGEDELGYAFVEPAAPWPNGDAVLPPASASAMTGSPAPSPTRPPQRPSAPPAAPLSNGRRGLSLPIVNRQDPAPLPAIQEPPTAIPGEAYLDLGTGRLSLEQVDMILRHLPVDLSFVDADGYVRYYSETPERLFPRTPGAIGRHVENCHPPKSVHMVKEILRAFAAGEREVAEFWIQMQGKFIHIRYFAVRNPAGEYLGCLEVSQDVTAIRALEGQRRLLEWD